MSSTKINTTFLVQLFELYNFALGPKRFIQSKDPKNVLCLWIDIKKKSYIFKYAMFCIISQPGTKYILRAFRVDESFWTQKQSCITQKVGLEKWCLFFHFVCFNGRHFSKSRFTKNSTIEGQIRLVFIIHF